MRYNNTLRRAAWLCVFASGAGGADIEGCATAWATDRSLGIRPIVTPKALLDFSSFLSAIYVVVCLSSFFCVVVGVFDFGVNCEVRGYIQERRTNELTHRPRARLLHGQLGLVAPVTGETE